MKKLTLIVAILLSGISLQAQSDIIYPAKSKKAIHRCKITEVRNGNVVYYIKNSKSDSIEALAIAKDGTYITFNINNQTNKYNLINQPILYKGYDYEYYKNLRKRAVIDRNIGIGITLLGFGTIAAGLNLGKNESAIIVAYILIGSGVLVTSIGISLWVYGATKAVSNKKAMNITSRNANLSFGVTNNGVGLVLNF